MSLDTHTEHPIAKRRLIVLVPQGLAGNSDLARKVFWIAIREHCDVLYLVFVDHEDEKLGVLRSMATMKALTADANLVASSKLTHSDTWLAALREIYRPGDQIVCHDEQYIRTGFLKTIQIHEAIADSFAAPIHSLSGFYHPWRQLSRKWLFGILFWLGCLVILSLFSMLEFQIDQTIQGLARSILIFIALVAEFGAFWAWNHLPRN
jgi:hypothetical protein